LETIIFDLLLFSLFLEVTVLRFLFDSSTLEKEVVITGLLLLLDFSSFNFFS